jgi:hypothetical protein
VGQPGPQERGRRLVLAQGLAALACFIAVQGAHGAVLPYTSTATPDRDHRCAIDHCHAVTGNRNAVVRRRSGGRDAVRRG